MPGLQFEVGGVAVEATVYEGKDYPYLKGGVRGGGLA